MKLKILFFTALMAGISLVHGQQNDQQLKRFLLGTWVAEQLDQIGQRDEITFQADGKFLQRMGSGAWVSGTWDVQDGVVFYHIIEWYPQTAQVNGGVIMIQKPGDSTNRIRVLDDNHVQNEDGSVSDRR